MSFWDLGLGGSTNKNSLLLGPLSALMGSGGDNGINAANVPSLQDIINQYIYKPQNTGQVENQLTNLFGQLTGTSGGGVDAIPFGLGQPTSGLYDSLTRGIKEQYFGTPGGPEGGIQGDTRAYYNNLGIPEYAANQERLGTQGLNNSLLDAAATVHNTYQDRLANILGMGGTLGTNLYNIDTSTQGNNAKTALAAGLGDAGIMQAIQATNQNALNSLYGGIAGAGGNASGSGSGLLSTLGSVGGSALGGSIGGPIGATAGATLGSQLASLFKDPTAPTSVSSGNDLSNKKSTLI